jgi:predicted transcriptional regulator
MKTVSLKIDDTIFGETEKILSKISIPRNRYINDAIDYYNKAQKRQILEKKLRTESELVSNESMAILKDFENIDYADESV